MAKREKKYNMDRDFLKEMLSQPFYNEKRIPGYNHVTGQLDSKQMPAKKGGKEYNVDLNTYLLCQ